MARETNSIATVWDIDNSNGIRRIQDSTEEKTCCLKTMLSGSNALWRNTIIPTGYSSNTMYVKFGDIQFATAYNNGFSVSYTKSGDASGTLYKWVKISNLGVNITGRNGGGIPLRPYTMSAYTSSSTIPIPYTVCSGDRVTFETSAATFEITNLTGGTGSLGGVNISGYVEQTFLQTFTISEANMTLNPGFVLYGNRNGGSLTPTGDTPTPSGTTYRSVTINLSQNRSAYAYGIQVGPLRITTGLTAAAAKTAAQSSTAASISSTLSDFVLTGTTRYSSGSLIKSDTFSIPSNAYLCVSATSMSYPKVRTGSTSAWLQCSWFSGTTATGAVQNLSNTFILAPNQISFYMVAGLGMQI